MPEVDLTVSPVVAIRRLGVGWTVPEVLFALVDNAVQAGAANVWVHVRRLRPDPGTSSRRSSTTSTAQPCPTCVSASRKRAMACVCS